MRAAWVVLCLVASPVWAEDYVCFAPGGTITEVVESVQITSPYGSRDDCFVVTREKLRTITKDDKVDVAVAGLEHDARVVKKSAAEIHAEQDAAAAVQAAKDAVRQSVRKKLSDLLFTDEEIDALLRTR